MIKLNNKNITYVALADSNNSLKAPKEIWYADSNNSVKLVYRRKDALIEGEDYEKYHWLCGRNGAYIDTNYKMQIFDDAFQIRARINDPTEANPDGGEQDLFGVMKNSGVDRCICFYQRNFGRLCFAYSNIQNGGNQVFFVNKNIFDATMYADQSNFFVTCNGETLSQTVGTLSALDNRNIALFQLTTEKSNNYFHGDIAYFRITDPAFTIDKVNMIPCKLLKPVPKWLDANGIRRQVGECGMIDLVSGKFYGNVNSVGTFTVENYYERKEWLQGDGSAYIKGIDYNLWANRVELKVGKINVTTTKNNELHYKPTDSDGNVWAVQQNPTFTPQFICIFRESGVVVHIVHIDLMPSQVTLSFYQNGGYAYCLYNDTENKGGTLNQPSWDTNIIPTIFSYKMSYIREVLPNGSYRSNLIPCTLTMDLPASMDANNIARTKGTSGMWDLVSDKFYGNVANSGTFKAVNLAEGVDYEVHQYLHAEVNTKAIMCILPVDSNVIEFKSKRIRGRNFHYFYTKENYIYFCASGAEKAIYDFGTPATIYYSSLVALGEEVIISCNDNKILMGNDELPIYGYPITSVRISVADSEGMETLTSSITVDGIERYIPVKLLRSIPSKYDANGIARQAGECGMYDTINDVFYGNVASSGTFTVEDDS